MNIWILIGLFLPQYFSTKVKLQYECGEHGRFEYCIDGIPGCVIGCHCHPGFYFDTETKICESNTKLMEGIRRRSKKDPTRIQIPVTQTEYTGPTSTPDPVDKKLDEITKDADDLGDWLYNQFFKTVENQVINNTNDKEKIISRRSGSLPLTRKSRKRSRKHSRRSGKKKKSRKNAFKKKILRITQDDSLFDSSADTSSDTSSSSSSSSDSSSSDSDEFSKTEANHGHKKLLLLNKKPKFPLPSFIFLPNMHTPFYPPIGLPPPPVVPMYPIVPVPPVAPLPFFGVPTPLCASENTSTTVSTTTVAKETSTTATTPTTTKTTTTSQPEKAQAPADADSVTTTATVEKLHAQFRPHKSPKKKSKKKLEYKTKFLQQIRDKLKGRKTMPSDNYYNDLSQEPQLPFSEENNRNRARLRHHKYDDEMPINDVDFKYLSQLIHRVDFNKTNNNPGHEDKMLPLHNFTPSRRNYNNNFYRNDYLPRDFEQKRNFVKQEVDNEFYSNLGRQIASMIRSIDANADRQVNIEIEKSDSQNPNHPIFNENTYAPRSYWERSVRSPFQRYFQPRTNMFQYLKNSNEHLFNLENRVEVAASTPRLMTLQELENILNNVNGNLNTDQANHQFRTINSVQIPTNKENYIDASPKRLRLNIIDEYRPQLKNIVRNPSRQKNSFENQIAVNETGNGKLNLNLLRPTRKPVRKITTLSDNPQIRQLQFLKHIRSSSMTLTTNNPNIPVVNPHNHKNIYLNNNIYEQTYPNLPTMRKQISQVINTPQRSYFHHEFHHFDYFDQ